MPSKTDFPTAINTTLNDMAASSSAVILGLIETGGTPDELTIIGRLAELGFLPGEQVTVLRRGPGGREPLAVQVGDTVFALRSLEAACIKVDSRSLAVAA